MRIAYAGWVRTSSAGRQAALSGGVLLFSCRSGGNVGLFGSGWVDVAEVVFGGVGLDLCRAGACGSRIVSLWTGGFGGGVGFGVLLLRELRVHEVVLSVSQLCMTLARKRELPGCRFAGEGTLAEWVTLLPEWWGVCTLGGGCKARL